MRDGDTLITEGWKVVEQVISYPKLQPRDNGLMGGKTQKNKRLVTGRMGLECTTSELNNKQK